MQTFPHPEISKACVLERLEDHRQQDRIIQGTYWEEGKGCAVGCTLESVRDCLQEPRIAHNSHVLYEKYLGVPLVLARLEDRIFEGLLATEARDWPLRFISAMPEGADLGMVWPRFAVWLLRDVVRSAIRPSSVKVLASIDAVAALYDRWIAGDKPASVEWQKARAAAYAYAAAAAAAAAADAAAYAAAADAAAYAAAYAYAAAAAAAADARAKSYAHMADKLVELLAAA